tara:strand:- start:583 stop:702 length:120 start_codon:yes stop_codon:yes gene_type:complete
LKDDQKEEWDEGQCRENFADRKEELEDEIAKIETIWTEK